MKIILDEELQEKILKITGTNYRWELQLHDIENLIEDLIYWYHKLEEELENKHYVEEPDYYKEWRDNNACK